MGAALVQEICFSSWIAHAYIHAGALFSTVPSNTEGASKSVAMPLLIRFRLAKDLSTLSRVGVDRGQHWGRLRETSW